MADLLGINARRLESYERGRVPLPYKIALKFGRKFLVNPVWLAEGTEIIHIKERVFPNVETDSNFHPRTLFSTGYDDFIKPLLSKGNPATDISQPAKDTTEQAILSKSQLLLDISFGLMDSCGVKREIGSLSELMNALRERTKDRGRKAALARELNVSRQAVDQWLAGNAKPSAETTFALLNWVKRPIAK